MPITIGLYQYDYADRDLLKTPQLTGKPRPSYPIEGNSDIYITEEDYMQFIDFYKPLKPTSRDPKRSNMFFIKDSPISDVGNGVGRFTRTWSVLPGASDKGYTRSEYESFAFTVPALDTAAAAFYQFPVASTSLAGGYHTFTVTVGAPPFNALDIIVNKPCTIFYTVVDPINGQQRQTQIVKKAIAVTSNTLKVEQITDIGAITFTGVQRTDLTQPNYTKQVMSRLDFTYFIEGENCTNVNSIPIIQELKIIDNTTGGRVEYLNEETTPSLDTWYDYVNAGTWIVVEPSIVRRWQGGIYERTTRYVRATL